MTKNTVSYLWLVALVAIAFSQTGCSQTKLYRGVYEGIIKGTEDAVHDAVFELVNSIVGIQGQDS